MRALAIAAVAAVTSAAPAHVTVAARPADALVDAPLRVVVAGLGAHSPVTVTATTRAADGLAWTSSVMARAGPRGRLELGSRRSARLLWSLRAASADARFVPPALGRVTIRVARGGRTLARTTIARHLRNRSVIVRETRLRAQGFVGRYFAPAANGARPAVLVLGGSEGGLPGDSTASLLAAHGFSALTLAYFGEPGLPRELKRIPLEYFRRALRWLAAQPGVDPTRLAIMGTSRGGEAALLLGATYPKLVGAVAAYVPSSVVEPALDFRSPAWTLNGRPVPHMTHDFGNPAPDDQAGAVIAVERIAGPVFVVGAVLDPVWPSALFVSAIVRRLRAHDRRDVTALIYEGAGHAVGTAVPNLPRTALGGSIAADAAARADSWPRLLRWLSAL